ncbi:MAG: hypothetical protein M1834_008541 [Cirrosporium novae-zelandiae]|nr:MAG: hypothetical protein M1834_008541 [Cirrosporium novae-zelandiae]
MAQPIELPNLLVLCDELLLQVFDLLDLPDLLACSRTCHRLRALACDPILHAHRLQFASLRLSHSLTQRPPLSSLRPPRGTIYISPTHAVARKISRSLVSIKLSRSLSHRPSASSLVNSNILPEECFKRDLSSGQVIWGGVISPSIISVKRQVEKEKLKDGLRAWLVGKAELVEKKAAAQNEIVEEEKPSVRMLVRRFGRRAVGSDNKETRWGRAAKDRKAGAPTRAHVLGLRRFWEAVARQSSAV